MKKSIGGQHQGSGDSNRGRKPTLSRASSPFSEPGTLNLNPGAAPRTLLIDVRELIVSTRQTVARGVNAALVLLYWKVGERIRRDVLKEKRAEYGEEIVSTLSAQWVPKCGPRFALCGLLRTIRLSRAFPDLRIVATLSQQLGAGLAHAFLLPCLSIAVTRGRTVPDPRIVATLSRRLSWPLPPDAEP